LRNESEKVKVTLLLSLSTSPCKSIGGEGEAVELPSYPEW